MDLLSSDFLPCRQSLGDLRTPQMKRPAQSRNSALAGESAGPRTAIATQAKIPSGMNTARRLFSSGFSCSRDCRDGALLLAKIGWEPNARARSCTRLSDNLRRLLPGWRSSFVTNKVSFLVPRSCGVVPNARLGDNVWHELDKTRGAVQMGS